MLSMKCLFCFVSVLRLNCSTLLSLSLLNFGNKKKCYSQVPRRSDTPYSACGNADTNCHNFSGISIDLGNRKNLKTVHKGSDRFGRFVNVRLGVT